MRGPSNSLKKDLAGQDLDRRHFIRIVGKESLLVADRIRRECVVFAMSAPGGGRCCRLGRSATALQLFAGLENPACQSHLWTSPVSMACHSDFVAWRAARVCEGRSPEMDRAPFVFHGRLFGRPMKAIRWRGYHASIFITALRFFSSVARDFFRASMMFTTLEQCPRLGVPARQHVRGGRLPHANRKGREHSADTLATRR